jgi:hypothetical protein
MQSAWEMRNAHKMLLENLWETDLLEDLVRMDGNIKI